MLEGHIDLNVYASSGNVKCVLILIPVMEGLHVKRD